MHEATLCNTIARVIEEEGCQELGTNNFEYLERRAKEFIGNLDLSPESGMIVKSLLQRGAWDKPYSLCDKSLGE